MLDRLLRFGLVGVAATLIHALIATSLMQLCGVAAQAANLVGWVIALLASYWGQARLTFADLAPPSVRSFARFLLASASLFAVNVIALEWMLWRGGVREQVAVPIAIALQAALGYVAQRWWVFRRPGRDQV